MLKDKFKAHNGPLQKGQKAIKISIITDID